MKKNWTNELVYEETSMGEMYKHWLITSPSGNQYLIIRSRIHKEYDRWCNMEVYLKTNTPDDKMTDLMKEPHFKYVYLQTRNLNDAHKIIYAIDADNVPLDYDTLHDWLEKNTPKIKK